MSRKLFSSFLSRRKSDIPPTPESTKSEISSPSNDIMSINGDDANTNNDKTKQSTLSPMNSNKKGQRKSIFNRLGMKTGNTEEDLLELDRSLASLYGDYNELEKRCHQTAETYAAPSTTSSSRKRSSSRSSWSQDLPTKDPNLVISSLHSGYFDTDFDPVQIQLNRYSEWSEEEVQEKFMAAIEEADTDKDAIISLLASKIQENYDDLTSCMTDVYDIDKDLARASDSVGTMRHNLNSADVNMTHVAMKVSKLDNRRRNLTAVRQVIESLNELRAIREKMVEDISTGELQSAAESALSVILAASDSRYTRFVATENLSKDVQSDLPPLRRLIDNDLKSLVVDRFDCKRYGSLMSANQCLDQIGDLTGQEIFDDEDMRLLDSSLGTGITSPLPIGSPQSSVVESLAGRLLDFQLQSVNGFMRTAAQEAFVASEQERNRLQNDNGVKSTDLLVDNNNEDWTEYYSKISTHQRAACVVRSTELLANLIHTHYMITQWHSSPFDEKAAGDSAEEYLHSKEIDLEAEASLANEYGFDSASFLTNDFDFDMMLSNDDDQASNSNNDDGKSDTVEADKDINISKTKSTSSRDSADEIQVSDGISEDKDNSMNKLSDNKIEEGVEIDNKSELSSKTSVDEIDDDNDGSADDSVIGNSPRTSPRNSPKKGRQDVSMSPLQKSQESLEGESQLDLSITIEEPVSATESSNASDEGTSSRKSFSKASLESRRSIRLRQLNDSIRNTVMTAFDIDVDVDSENTSSISADKETSSSSSSVITTEKLNRISSARMTVCHLQLLAGREMLWHEIERVAIKMLEAMDFGASVALEDFLTSMWALRTLIKLGQEFCGAKAIVLDGCIRDKANSYFARLHVESMQMLQQMLEAENWQSVPIQLEEHGGIIGLINMNLGKVRTADSRARLRPKGMSSDTITGGSVGKTTTKSSILCSFFTLGNPFSLDTSAEENSGGNSPKSSREARFKATTEEESPLNSNESATMTIVTQACLNGLVRYAGLYLHLMELLGQLSPKVFEGVCQLFDFYLCWVFVIFSDSKERKKLTGRPQRLTSPPPIIGKEFQALAVYIDRAMNEPLPIQTISSSENFSKSRKISGHDQIQKQKYTISNQIENVEYNFDDSESIPGLVERVIACESCSFAAKILHALRPQMEQLLPTSHIQGCVAFASIFQQITTQLRGFTFRTMCPQLINYSDVLSKINDTYTDKRSTSTSNATSTHNSYISVILARLEEIRKFLLDAVRDSRIPLNAKEKLWIEVIQCSYDALLEGYSRLKRFTNDTRTSMLEDATAFYEGVNTLGKVEVRRGLDYIKAYLQASSLDDDAFMEWTRTSWQDYAYRHVIAQVQQRFGSVLGKKRLKEAVEIVDNLYALEQDFEDNTSERRKSTMMFALPKFGSTKS